MEQFRPWYKCGNNIFCCNNIINNVIQACVNRPDWNANNRFYHPTLLEGNYWSDYVGLDDGSGVSKHAIAGDGIGDTLIPHPTLGYDNYPFVYPNGWLLIEATIDIDPNTLSLKSHGKWITCYIELPAGYDVGQIDVSSIMLNGAVSAEAKPTEIGNYDNDEFPDLMVKFDRSAVQALFPSPGVYTVTITGAVADILFGTPFRGTSPVRVIK